THLGVAKLTMIRPLYFAAQLGGHGLHAIAYAQHRHARLEDLGGHFHGFFRIGRGVATRQDDALQALLRLDESVIDVTRMDFAVDARFADAPCNKLSDL